MLKPLFVLTLLVGLGGCASVAGTPPAPSRFLVSYFYGQDSGARLALSDDGIHWTPVNGGEPVLRPFPGELVRDPSIIRGPDGVYHMVWTTGWTGHEIGYAWSRNLIHWSGRKKVPLMTGTDAGHTWAPELFFDDRTNSYLIAWSSDGTPWAIHYVTTKDFESFSERRLLFTNGEMGGGKAGNNGPIDGYILEDAPGKYLFFYKKDDNTGVPNLFFRWGASPTGPWGEDQGPITPSTGDEGPSVLKVGDEYRVYTDPFESEFMYMYASTDLKHWTRVETDLRMSHGTVTRIPDGEARALEAAR
jgi:beta-galactosidase